MGKIRKLYVIIMQKVQRRLCVNNKIVFIILCLSIIISCQNRKISEGKMDNNINTDIRFDGSYIYKYRVKNRFLFPTYIKDEYKFYIENGQIFVKVIWDIKNRNDFINCYIKENDSYISLYLKETTLLYPELKKDDSILQIWKKNGVFYLVGLDISNSTIDDKLLNTIFIKNEYILTFYPFE